MAKKSAYLEIPSFLYQRNQSIERVPELLTSRTLLELTQETEPDQHPDEMRLPGEWEP